MQPLGPEGTCWQHEPESGQEVSEWNSSTRLPVSDEQTETRLVTEALQDCILHARLGHTTCFPAFLVGMRVTSSLLESGAG